MGWVESLLKVGCRTFAPLTHHDGLEVDRVVCEVCGVFGVEGS